MKSLCFLISKSNRLIIVLVLVMGSCLFSEISAKNIRVFKSGGKKHWFSDKITYNRIEQKFDSETGHLTYQSCTGKGNEVCPKITMVSVGDFNGSNNQKVNGLEIIKYAQKQFVDNSSGKAYYKGVFVSWRNAKVVELEDGNIDYEYELFISDELKNAVYVINLN